MAEAPAEDDFSAFRAGEPAIDAVRAFLLRVDRGVGLISVERVRDGVSTYVYRLRYGDRTEYLRVWPLRDESLASECLAYRALRERGVTVLEVVYFSAEQRIDGLSALITSEVPGIPLAAITSDVRARRVAREAGRQLALMQGVPVDGYGWVRRDVVSADHLTGEHADYRSFWQAHLDTDVRFLARQPAMHGLAEDVGALVAEHSAWLDSAREDAIFAHGDFDVSAIHAYEGHLAGIIDLSEMRGTDRWYDLGHFYLHDGESYPVRLNDALHPVLLSDALLEGYGAVKPLPSDARQRIAFAGLLIGLRTYVRAARKDNTRLRDWMATRLTELRAELGR